MADDQKPLDEILDRSTPPVEKPATQGEDKGTQPRDDSGRWASQQPKPAVESQPAAPTGEATAAPPAAVQQPQQQPWTVPGAAFVDMRLEARQAKQERDEYRRQLQEIERAKNAQPVDWYADPEAARKQDREQIRQEYQSELQKVRHEMMTDRLEASTERVIAKYGEQAYNEMNQAIDEAMASGDPEVLMLRNQLLQSLHPVKDAMEWFGRRKLWNDTGGDPAAYEQRIREKVLAEMNGGQQPAQHQQLQQRQSQPPVMPSNLAGARNVGTRSGPTWAGPAPIGDIFARGRPSPKVR